MAKNNKMNFSYDRESDDLFLYSSKSKGSIEIGDFILDFNNRKELVGLELMNASRVLEDITGENVNKLLNNLYHYHNSANIQCIECDLENELSIKDLVKKITNALHGQLKLLKLSMIKKIKL